MNNKLSREYLLNEFKQFRLPKLFLAGFWVRLGAYFLDIVIINAVQAIVLNLTIYRFLGLSWTDSFLVTLIELIIFVSYFYLTTTYFNGQTPGKMVFGIRVIPIQEEKSMKTVYFIRELCGKVIYYYFPYIAVLLVFSHKNQTVLDMLADTVVIREERLSELQEFLN